MWETGRNEGGQKLSKFEFGALVERWCDLFGDLPPDDAPLGIDVADQPMVPAPEPEPDTMLRMPEVVRLTGLSVSTIKRMVLDDRFPKPMRLSPRRIGWPAREVKTWIDRLDDQRHSPRQ
jgi:prophage regulatory protein